MATFNGTSGNDVITPAVPGGPTAGAADTFFGSGGNDTLDGGGTAQVDVLDYRGLAGTTLALQVLAPIAGSGTNFRMAVAKSGTGAGTDDVTNVLRVFGTAGADSFTGLAGLSLGSVLRLSGGLGNDLFSLGMNGWYMVDYFDATGAMTISLATGAGGTATGAGVGTDTLDFVSRVRGGGFNDRIFGTANNEFFAASGGTDTYVGGAGRDEFELGYFAGGWAITLSTVTVEGWTGTATKAGGGVDSFIGMESITAAFNTPADDSFTTTVTSTPGQPRLVLRGNGGNDSYNLAANANITVSYASLSAGYVIDLGAGTVTGSGKTDTLVGVRSVGTSTGSDTVTGTVVNDIFFGGRGGSDSFAGGGGIDQLRYDLPGADNPGALTFTITANGQGTVAKSTGGTDSFSGILGIVAGGAGNDTFTPGTTTSGTYDGAGGRNALNYAGVAGPVTVTFGGTAYVGIATKSGGTDAFSNIATVIGTAAGDTLTGSTDASSGLPFAIILRGGGGNDTIDGASSLLNRADYFDATSGIVADLGAGSASGGGVGADTLVDVIRIAGSGLADTITGSAAFDRFDATNGNDTYFGGGGGAFVDYANYAGIAAIALAPDAGLFGYGNLSVTKPGVLGTDTLNALNQVWGTAGNDAFTGISAAVLYSWNTYNMRGGAGNDSYQGFGNLNNRADYSGLNARVVVDLLAGTADKGANGTDTLSDIRNVRGTNFDDTLLGTDGNDVFLIGEAGAHVIDGRGGSDRYTYAGTTALVVDLLAGTAMKAGGTIVDTLTSIENVLGGEGDDTLSGDGGDNILYGGAGNNVLNGGGGEDWASFRIFFSTVPTTGGSIDLRTGTALNPFGGTDALSSIEHAAGGAFAETLTGLVRNDGLRSFLRGGGGDDTLRALTAGGAVTTTTTITADYLDALSRVVVDLAAGLTTDDGYFGGQDTLVGIRSVRGSNFGDILDGSAQADMMDAGAGNDTLSGGDGDDTLFGGAGDDTLLGGDGADLLAGEGGTDRLEGGAGDDVYFLSAGATVIEAAAGGFDTVFVGFDDWAVAAEVEQVVLHLAATRVEGTAGNDRLVANAALGSTLAGLGGADLLLGGAQDDLLDGGAGADTLLGQGGNDILAGGADDDLYVLSSASTIVELPGGGQDVAVFGGGTGLVLAAEVETGVLVGTALSLTLAGSGQLVASFAGAGVTLGGGGGADTLFGNAAFGDTLRGGGGDDILDGLGAPGGDQLEGGAGDDIFVVNTALDTAAEIAGGGNDVAFVYASAWTMGAEIETGLLLGGGQVLLAGAGAQTLAANAAIASTLGGGGGDDVLVGNALVQEFIGGAGDDWIISDGGADRVVMDAPGWGKDVVFNGSAALVLDFRGSGLAGLGSFDAVAEGGGGVIFVVGADSLAIFGMTRAEAEAAMLF